MDEACPLPSANPTQESDRDAMKAMLAMHTVAVVGMTPDPHKPSHYVPEDLRAQGRHIVPINPNYEEIDGHKCYPSLTAVPTPIEVVLVFRRSEFCPQVAREAAAAKAKGLWLQSGITSPESRQIAQAANLQYIENRCMLVEARRAR